MYKVKFIAHNSTAPDQWCEAKVAGIEAAYQLVCALNYTGFSFNVFAPRGGDITTAMENRMRDDGDLPVCKVASALPRAFRERP